MTERVVDIVIPSARRVELTKILEEQELERHWALVVDPQAHVRVLVPAERVESLVDETERVFSGADPFWIVVASAEACIPLPRAPEATAGLDHPQAGTGGRLSRQELYDDLAASGRVDRIFVVTVVLSTVVAAIGLLKDSGAIIIGAMVLAPLLGPNMLLAFATTLGDFHLGLRALRANAIGFLVAVLAAAPIASFAPLDLEASEVAARLHVDLADFVLALASGIAGALASTTGLASSLVGVMVAVAILPPAVCSSMLLADGRFSEGLSSLLLVAVNVVCVNLAAVSTFLWRGIGPRSWWAASRSRRATRLAIGLWIALVGVLIALVALSL